MSAITDERLNEIAIDGDQVAIDETESMAVELQQRRQAGKRATTAPVKAEPVVIKCCRTCANSMDNNGTGLSCDFYQADECHDQNKWVAIAAKQPAPPVVACPHCNSTLLWSEDRGAHCDGCDKFDESEDLPKQKSQPLDEVEPLPMGDWCKPRRYEIQAIVNLDLIFAIEQLQRRFDEQDKRLAKLEAKVAKQ